MVRSTPGAELSIDVSYPRSYRSLLVCGRQVAPQVMFICRTEPDLTFMLEVGRKISLGFGGTTASVCSSCYRLFEEGKTSGKCPLCATLLSTLERNGNAFRAFMQPNETLPSYLLTGDGEKRLARSLTLWASRRGLAKSVIETELWALTLASEFVALQNSSLYIPRPQWSSRASWREVEQLLTAWTEKLNRACQNLNGG